MTVYLLVTNDGYYEDSLAVFSTFDLAYDFARTNKSVRSELKDGHLEIREMELDGDSTDYQSTDVKP